MARLAETQWGEKKVKSGVWMGGWQGWWSKELLSSTEDLKVKFTRLLSVANSSPTWTGINNQGIWFKEWSQARHQGLRRNQSFVMDGWKRSRRSSWVEKRTWQLGCNPLWEERRGGGSWPVGAVVELGTGVEFRRQCRSPDKQASLRQCEFSWFCAPWRWAMTVYCLVPTPSSVPNIEWLFNKYGLEK